jgi:hypothetical protein
MKLVDKYREFCSVKVGAGDTALFWFDSWHGGHLHSQFPRLFSFAIDQNISVRDFIGSEDRTQFFQQPMSPQAFEEFQEMELNLLNVHCDPMVSDVWSTIWKDGVYSSRLYYQYCFKDIVASKIYSAIWSSKVMLRIKVFAWLLVSDRLNTRDMIRRRHWNVTNNQFHCVLCPTHLTEDWMHLFFDCNFSIRIWCYLQIQWEPGDTFEEIFFAAKRKFQKPFFSEVVILALWHIWKQRNEAIFQGIMPTFRGWRRRFIHDATMHVHRVKAKHSDSFSRWIESLL